MICPVCKADYRPGFTRCADCDVDLVNTYEEAVRRPVFRESPAPENYPEPLWRGTDPHFYLGLLRYLGSKRVLCLGRPVNPPPYDSFEEQPAGSWMTTEFEVLVSRQDVSFARWILHSAEAMYKEEETPGNDAEGEPDEPEASLDVAGVCPLCDGEFASASSLCPNCGVPLRSPRLGSFGENPVKLLCDLPHPSFLADLRKALHIRRIPFNNANFPEGPDSRRTDVLVLDSDFDRATQVLAQLLQYWEFDQSFKLGLSSDPRDAFWPMRADDNGWYPEDLEFLLWTGSSVDALDSVGMALREHEIAYRVEVEEPDRAKIFIHPDDESRAQEILREVGEGQAPE